MTTRDLPHLKLPRIYPVKLYVASSWSNEHQPTVVSALRERHHEVYDFRAPHLGPGRRGIGFSWDDVDPDWRDWTTSDWRDGLAHPAARDGFAADLEGMQWADCCVLVLPSGRSAHTEAGWMSGQGKPVLVYAPTLDTPDLMHSLFQGIHDDLDELLDAADTVLM